jgi:dolichol-phosphate mannosyltransferase
MTPKKPFYAPRETTHVLFRCPAVAASPVAEKTMEHQATQFSEPLPPPSTVLVLATYNEAPNLARLIPVLFEVVTTAHVVVVDDNSPDGTPAFLLDLSRTYPRLHPLIRPRKQGYGTAVLEGFRAALAMGAERIVTLDADFSHDPHDVPALTSALDHADTAIGSRYVGGVRVLNWHPSRLLLSLFANRYVKTILGLKVEDATSGFRAYRREAIEALLANPPHSVGYSFLVEILYRLHCLRLAITEVPIIYTERREGQSKMSRGVIGEAILRPWLLRLGRKPQPADLKTTSS